MHATCEITFDKPNGVYFSGNILNGKVKLITNKEKSARGVYITIKGFGKVRWDERKTRVRSIYTEVYYAFDNYLSSKTYVMGDENGDTFILPPGIHEYTFSAVLPPSLPSSFTGKYGHIKYEVIVTIDRPLRFDNVFKQPFTVIQNSDLNFNPINLQPKEDEQEKNFCCCCCISGPVKTKLWIPFGGYAPGQKIKYTLFVDNESKYDLDGSEIKFKQRVSYTSRTPYRKTRHEDLLIASEKLESVRRYTKKNIIKEFLIPNLPSSTDEAIIKIEYFLTAEIETGACHINNTITVPIVIGNEPIRTIDTHLNRPVTAQPAAGLLLQDYFDSRNTIPSYTTISAISPPSFEEATGLNKHYEDAEGKHPA